MFIHDRYEDALSAMLSQYHFELFATISLGVPYTPEDLESRLRRALKRVTGTPYQCGFYGVYSDYGTPHVHLLLASAGERLDPELIGFVLAKAFARKHHVQNDIKLQSDNGKDAEVVKNVEREHFASVNVQKIFRLPGLIDYLCRQYPDMRNHTNKEICGNLKALIKTKVAGHRQTLSELTQDNMADFVWDADPASASPVI